MKSIKYFSLGTFAVLALMISIGVVIADPMIPQTPEIQGFTSGTTMNVVGLAMENDAIAWQDSNLNLSTTLATPSHMQIVGSGPYYEDVPGLYPVLDADYGNTPGQDIYTVAYDEATTAVNGNVAYNKGLSINTGNKVASQSNINADKVVTFSGTDAGAMQSSEDLMVDGAGQVDYTNTRMLCPFAATSSSLIPPFCNIVQTGSSVDLTSGRLVTSSHERTVAATADPGVEAGHDISVTGIGDSPALGSANAYFKLHTQEGSGKYVADLITMKIYKVSKLEDMQYSETTSASPVIAKFTKSMDYNSGLNTL